MSKLYSAIQVDSAQFSFELRVVTNIRFTRLEVESLRTKLIGGFIRTALTC